MSNSKLQTAEKMDGIEQEKLIQENFSLRRELSALQNTNRYLSEELEVLTAEGGNIDLRISEVRAKYETKIESCKKSEANLLTANDYLEAEIERLKKELHEKPTCNHPVAAEAKVLDETDPAGVQEELLKYKECVEQIEEELKEAKERIFYLTSEVETQRETIESLQIRLDTKKLELEDKCQQIDNLQEKTIDLSVELETLRSSKQNHNEKGNSLFAEVDDHRQKIKELLLNQQADFKLMKTLYEDSKHEIRRLKHENQEISLEMAECKRLFETAAPVFKEGVFERISYLEKENEILLAKLSAVVKENYAEILLNLNKNEMARLKESLYSCLQKRTCVEENLMKMQQECAKLKLETLELKVQLRRASAAAKSPKISEDKENSPLCEDGTPRKVVLVTPEKKEDTRLSSPQFRNIVLDLGRETNEVLTEQQTNCNIVPRAQGQVRPKLVCKTVLVQSRKKTKSQVQN